VIHRRAGAVCALVVLGALASCGPKNFANQNDELRREREDLRAEIASLQSQLAESNAKLAALTAPPPPGNLTGPFDAAEVAAATPVCVALDIDRLSGLRDSTDDGVPDLMVVRVRTLDGRSRFTQVVGRLDVQVDLVRGDASPTRIGQVSLGPAEVREAFRSGFGGTWYAVDVPVTIPTVEAGDRVLVRTLLLQPSAPPLDSVRILEGIGDRWIAVQRNP